MQRRVFAVWVILSAQNVPCTQLRAQQAERIAPTLVLVPSGTPFKIRTANTISSRDSTTGDGFYATLAEPVSVAGRTLIPKGAGVNGVIVNSNDGRTKGLASLSLRVTSIEVQGKSAAIQSSLFVKDAPKIKSGAPAVVDAESILSFQFVSPLEITSSR